MKLQKKVLTGCSQNAYCWYWALTQFLLALVFHCKASAQDMNSGKVSGLVMDAAGHPIVGVHVIAKQMTLDLTFEAFTTNTGEYEILELPPGEFTVSAEFNNFAVTSRTCVVHAGETTVLDLALKITANKQSLTVTEAEPILQARTAEIDDIVEGRKLTQVPLNGRNFIQLALFSDGGVIPPGGTRGASLQQAGQLVNVEGQRSGHNIYLVDGTTVTDQFYNNLVVSPSIDAIQKCRLQKSMYSAEYGGKASALINVVTKSGSNDLHGVGFEFIRNGSMDAKNYFDDPQISVPPFRQNDFGGSLGGPVVIPGFYDGHGKTFFFLNYEGLRERKSDTNLFSVPTAAMRAGDFSGLLTIYDPLTTAPSGSRQLFTDNIIPQNRINSLASALLRDVTLPNLPGITSNLRAVEGETANLDNGTARVDHVFSNGDAIFSRFSIFKVSAFQPLGSSTLNEVLVPGFGRNLTTDSKNAVAEYRHAFTPWLLNTFRAGWLSVSGGQFSQNQGNDFASQSGLDGVSHDPRDTGYPQVSFAGQFSTIWDPTTFVSRSDRSFDMTDMLLIEKGKHIITTGAYFYYMDFNPVNPANARGSFSFSPQWTSSAAGATDGNAFADFLLGYPAQASSGIGRADEHAHTDWIHPFVQDNWRVSKNLTVDLGLRWEYNSQVKENENRLSLVDFNLDSQTAEFVIASDGNGTINQSGAPYLSLIPVPYESSALAGWSNSLLANSYKRFSPRVGLAWWVPVKFPVVVHSGFGIFNNQAAYNIQQSLAQTLPFFLAKSVSTSSTTLVPTLQTEDILALGSQTPGSISGSTMIHNFRPEYNEAWSLSIQHQLRPDLVYEVGYFGSRTVHADDPTMQNVPLPGPGPIASRRPVSALAQFSTIRWDGWSSYNALRLRLEKRNEHGLYLSANYSWSKSLDDASDAGGTNYETNVPQNVYDLSAEKSLSSYDHRHRGTISALYKLPQFHRHGLLDSITSNWSISSLFIAQSGAPFTVNIGSDRANVGSGPAQRPDVIADPKLSSGRTVQRWFNTDAFFITRSIHIR
jgi:hypothetical protein